MSCSDEIRAAMGAGAENVDIAQLLDGLQMRADSLRRQRPELSTAELHRLAADELTREARMHAAVLKRNAKLNAVLQVQRRTKLLNAANPILSMQQMLIGGNHTGKGAMLGVEQIARARRAQMLHRVQKELEANGLWVDAASRKLDRAVALELAELRTEGGRPGRSGNSTARQIAEVLDKYQEAGRQSLNKAGAWIGRAEGWVARTAHDSSLIARAGFEAWRETVLPRLDLARTFGDRADDPAHIDQMLGEIYANLVSGVHDTSSAFIDVDSKAPAFSGPANLAKKLSQSRVLHWKDGGAWHDYITAFGGRGLFEIVINGLERAAEASALMEVFGTNPRAAMDADLEFITKQRRAAKDLAQATALQGRDVRQKFSNLMDQLDGAARQPVNRQWAMIWQSVRQWQTLSKLGGVLLSSITDAPLKAAELEQHGIGFLEGYKNTLDSVVRGQGGAPGTRDRGIMHDLGAAIDGMRAQIMSRFDGEHALPGAMTKWTNFFFKLSGLNWWTESQRAGARWAMSANWGRNIGTKFADLKPELRQMLENYNITADEWAALGTTEMARDDAGRAHLTPHHATQIGDHALEPIIASKLAELRAGALARLEKLASSVDQLAAKLRELDTILQQAAPGERALGDIEIKATIAAYAQQSKAVQDIRNAVIAMRDGGANANQVLAAMREQVQRLADAEKRITADMLQKLDRTSKAITRTGERRAQAAASIDGVRQSLAGRLAEIDAMPNRLDAAIADARQTARDQLAMKLFAYLEDRSRFAILEPGAGERAMMYGSTRAGTLEGEVLRFIWQFKAFPVAMVRKVWGREWQGRATIVGSVGGLAHIALGTTLFGYMSGVLKDWWKGREARDPKDPATWAAAFIQGGGAGIFGDYLFGKTNRFGNPALESAAGPGIGAASELWEIYNGARAGDDKSAAMIRFGLSNTPFINLFYTRALLDYAFIYQLQEARNPGFLRRMERRLEKDTGQHFMLRPSEIIPYGGGWPRLPQPQGATP